MTDSNDNMYLTIDSLIEINDIITTGSNNITLGKGNLKSYGVGKMYKNKDLMEGKPYQIIDQCKEKKINTCKENYLILLN